MQRRLLDAAHLRRETREAYTRNASFYVERTAHYAQYPGLRQEVTSFLELIPTGNVLDVGCGSGRDSLVIAESGRDVVCGDASLGVLKLLTDEEALRQVVCCDVVNLPFHSSVFAGLLASGVLLHLLREDCAKSLREFYRVLAPEGVALISMRRGLGAGWELAPDFPERRWFTFYDPVDFATLCDATGFDVHEAYISKRQNWFSVLAQRPS